MTDKTDTAVAAPAEPEPTPAPAPVVHYKDFSWRNHPELATRAARNAGNSGSSRPVPHSSRKLGKNAP